MELNLQVYPISFEVPNLPGESGLDMRSLLDGLKKNSVMLGSKFDDFDGLKQKYETRDMVLTKMETFIMGKAPFKPQYMEAKINSLPEDIGINFADPLFSEFNFDLLPAINVKLMKNLEEQVKENTKVKNNTSAHHEPSSIDTTKLTNLLRSVLKDFQRSMWGVLLLDELCVDESDSNNILKGKDVASTLFATGDERNCDGLLCFFNPDTGITVKLTQFGGTTEKKPDTDYVYDIIFDDGRKSGIPVCDKDILSQHDDETKTENFDLYARVSVVDQEQPSSSSFAVSDTVILSEDYKKYNINNGPLTPGKRGIIVSGRISQPGKDADSYNLTVESKCPMMVRM